MTPDEPERLTHQLNRTDTSGRSRWKRVAPLVDRELRKVAAVALRQFSAVNWHPTLQPEELVNEFYLRLLHADGRHWENSKHFFAYASASMRNILTDRHRARKAGRSLPANKGRTLEELPAHKEPARGSSAPELEVGLALERLNDLSPRQAEIIDLRFFAGMEISEIAAKLELSEKTVWRDWLAARAFLYAELSGLRLGEEVT